MSKEDINYTNVRDKIMDKYWLDFLADIEGDIHTSTYVARLSDAQFWEWFYAEKAQKNIGSLENYL